MEPVPVTKLACDGNTYKCTANLVSSFPPDLMVYFFKIDIDIVRTGVMETGWHSGTPPSSWSGSANSRSAATKLNAYATSIFLTPARHGFDARNDIGFSSSRGDKEFLHFRGNDLLRPLHSCHLLCCWWARVKLPHLIDPFYLHH